MTFPYLSALTFLPVAAAVILLLLPSTRIELIRRTAAILSLVPLAFTLCLWHIFDSTRGTLQFEERHSWIPALHVDYRLAIDGIGLLMLLLAAVVIPIGIAASWRIQQRTGLYFALIFLLQSCMFGAFTAFNFIHFFLFWELSLVPAFFLIRLWGARHAAPAAMQFLVYTMVGSVAMLLTFLAIFLTTGTFDFTDLAILATGNQLIPAVAAHLNWHTISPAHLELLLFAGAFLGFAVKVPLIPFHTWQPVAYAEAPSGTTAILTGAMSKMGVYGFLRILIPIFYPQMRQVLTPLLWLAVATIVLSAFAALAQKDLKRIFAYSSINHLGYCLLAAFALVRPGTPLAEHYAALSGILLQLFSHALTAAVIFWFISLIESRSSGDRFLSEFGGLRRIAPVFTGLMGIALFSSLGLPGLNGFPGEFLIFKGSFPLTPLSTSISVLGLLITAAFILNVIQQLFTGPLNAARAGFSDLTRGERLALAPAIALIFLFGLCPQLLLGPLNATVTSYMHHYVVVGRAVPLS